jgi:ubiquitin-conjugating enzyme E2 J2
MVYRWHYILTGPPNTPYEGGQYWGSLIFPPEYPFAPPAIRMHTPSGRFQPSTRLCLSISDFHPKSFNPAWEVSTILIGLLSFMTSDEMTTGSVSATEADRRYLAKQTRWWNSTGGGSHSKLNAGVNPTSKGIGAIKAGDGGIKFRTEWPDLDEDNWRWMNENKIDHLTGKPPVAACSPETAALGKRPGGSGALGEVQAARNAGESWLRRNKYLLGGLLIFGYVILARLLGDQESL